MNYSNYCAFMFIIAYAGVPLCAMEQERSSNMIGCEQKIESLVNAQGDYIKLITNDGHEFIVPKEKAMLSGTIKSMFSDSSFQLDEMQTQVINFREINGATLETIFKLLSQEKRNPKNGIVMPLDKTQRQYRYRFLKSLSFECLQELLLVLNFLDIEILMDWSIEALIVKSIEKEIGIDERSDILPFLLADQAFYQKIEQGIKEKFGLIFPPEIISCFHRYLKARRGVGIFCGVRPIIFLQSQEKEVSSGWPCNIL